ncbi:hypothetical protein [Eggerthella sp. YY7918]|uniref:hypothetical protein n=1 Tax=Eggerthella sp. (strain YY7918) TaxID=502558 RepID=UPI00059EF78E|nr:hypothetical protein [Eggerthella sp. YY7918]
MQRSASFFRSTEKMVPSAPADKANSLRADEAPQRTAPFSKKTAPRSNRCLFGFRSGKTWHKVCIILLFAAVYIAFVLTAVPPVPAGNGDVVIYKLIRLVVLALPIVSILLLSDFSWCKKLPLFSSARTSQRVLGVATLAALLICLCANLTYLHTPEYREAVTAKWSSLISPKENIPHEEASTAPDRAPESAEEAPSTTTSDEGFANLNDAWNERREGCGTD